MIAVLFLIIATVVHHEHLLEYRHGLCAGKVACLDLGQELLVDAVLEFLVSLLKLLDLGEELFVL